VIGTSNGFKRDCGHARAQRRRTYQGGRRTKRNLTGDVNLEKIKGENRCAKTVIRQLGVIVQESPSQSPFKEEETWKQESSLDPTLGQGNHKKKKRRACSTAGSTMGQ